MYNITATIVTYNNSYSMLKKAMDSFLSTSLNVRLYIVDNSPNDKIKDYCKDERIEYYFVGKNIGFGAGHNIILRQKEKLGVYHLILNPDIIIPKDTLSVLLKYYEKNTSIGMMSPRIFFPDNSIQYLPKILPSPLNLVIRFIPFLDKIFYKTSNNYVLKNANYNKPFNIGILSGCFMLIKSDKLENILFDEHFFMYFEDFDFSRRIGKKYDLILYPNAHIYHDYGRGSHKNIRLFITFIKSLFIYFNKWGWFHDKYRRKINEKILNQFK